MFSILVFFHSSHLITVQDSNPSNGHLHELFLLPSRLTKQLDDLSLFLGRLSSLPTSFTRTNPVSSTSPVRLTAGGHLFHLHLELNWAAIQTLCLIMEKQGMRLLFISVFYCTTGVASLIYFSLLFRSPAERQGDEKLVYRLIQLFSSTEIFSKRRKIYACWRKTRVKIGCESKRLNSALRFLPCGLRVALPG